MTKTYLTNTKERERITVVEVFEITKDMMLSAKTYMDLESKEDLARNIARRVLRPMPTAKQNHPADELISMPMMMEENVKLKSILLMVTLFSYYFDITFTEDESGLLRFDYDFYAGGHPLNQIERFKSDRETKDIAFDLIEDFREFKKIVDTMVYNEKANANDPVGRFMASIAVLSTPENVQTLMSELTKSTDELQSKIIEAKKAEG